MESQAPEGSQSAAQAAAQAVAPDPVTASLLAKHSSGQPLSQSEYGKLGAFAKKAKNFVFGKSGQPAGHTRPPPLPGNAPAVAALPSGETSEPGMARIPADPRVVQRTTESIIKACDGIARRKLVNEARKAGADERTANRFDAAVAVPVAAKDMMVETSPDVAAALGIDPSSYPIATFCGGLGLWATNIWLALDELKQLQKERQQQDDRARADRLRKENAERTGPVLASATSDSPLTPGNAPV